MPQDDLADTEQSRTPPGGFWYPIEEAGTGSAVEVLRAVRRFRVADLAMRNKARTDMDMNDSDLVALRHLIAAGERHESIGPKDLSVHLGITSAATAKLLSRLEGAGRLLREPHPSDRRAQVLHATVSAYEEVRQVLGSAHRRMLEAAEKLTVAEQSAVVRFLDELSGAMAEPDDEQDATDDAGERAAEAPAD
ncbi:MAG: MarR family transcriptional regulator [Cryobacterium sp.]